VSIFRPHPTRRQALAAAAAPLLAPTVLAQKKSAPSGPPPNVLVILADDLAAWMLGTYGNQEIKTPNIDNLARRGVKFLNHYVCTPICSASRATLLTGRVPRQHGIHDFLTNQPEDNPPQGQKEPPASFQKEVMLSDVLAARGYQCGYVGKWHLGNDQEPGHGYQWWATMVGGSASYQDLQVSLNGKLTQESGFSTEAMTRRATQFLDQQSGAKPFFLVASYQNPHLPYSGHPQKYYDLYKDTKFDTIGWEPKAKNALREKELMNDPVGNLRKCAASVTALDDQIPVLLKKLQEKSLTNNTIVVFTGDNGFLLGRHGLWSKGLASDPINMYEEVMEVPLLMSWAGKIPVESSKPDLVSFYDFVPTICEAAGADLPNRNLCGRSYLNLALNRPFAKGETWRTTVFGHFRNTEMARDKRFKLVWRNNGQGPNELFDVPNDPGERVNQFDNPRFLTVKERLIRELADWRSRTSA
jgi:arylsulfatase A-like enzyme